jgi:hypothetical protein
MAMLLELLMNGFPIRLRPLLHRFRPNRLVPKQLSFQFLFAEAFGQRPTDPSRRRPFQILVDRAQPHPTTACDLALPEAQLKA